MSTQTGDLFLFSDIAPSSLLLHRSVLCNFPFYCLQYIFSSGVIASSSDVTSWTLVGFVHFLFWKRQAGIDLKYNKFLFLQTNKDSLKNNLLLLNSYKRAREPTVKKTIPHLPPIYQFCRDALFSHLMFQVIFCAPWEQWHHKWATADVQRRKPFPLFSPYHQLIVQYNKYFLIVGNLILTSNQMDVIERTFCIYLPQLFSSFFCGIFQIFRHEHWFIPKETEQNCSTKIWGKI